MRLAMLSSPRTTTTDGEFYRLRVPAARSSARVAREALRAILERHHPELIETARLGVTDAMAYVLNCEPLHATITVSVWVGGSSACVAVEDGDGNTDTLYTLDRSALDAASLLAALMQIARRVAVSRTWDGAGGATRVHFELSAEGPVQA
ncbi:hypothetical protein LE181_15210 [Streptomyces sp. SCA3-4]|uniref:hypothetical protein n=1 Tax=Streptomyces sichuanensis TaxID=2871810 RepID=UPI001CE24107|nr:hypothetical protein [Streptomyces sichuanensis]MCA6093504.1 hypothetical protein [Streptomyces sichuanensis]